MVLSFKLFLRRIEHAKTRIVVSLMVADLQFTSLLGTPLGAVIACPLLSSLRIEYLQFEYLEF